MANKIFRGFFYFLINPSLFLKYVIRVLRLRLMPRYILLRQIARAPYKYFGDVIFPLDQKDPITQKGVVERYTDYITIERSIKATMLQVNEIDVEVNIRKFLDKGDVFFDVGAQFGYFSAIGAECVGEGGQVHMFEPVPFCIEYLEDLRRKNPKYHFIVNKVAVGDKAGVAEIILSSPPHLSSHSFISDFHKSKGIVPWVKFNVPVVRLDDYISKKRVIPKLIKIDVEGYEFKVLRGLENFWRNTAHRPTIICEITPVEYRSDELFAFMKYYKYEAFYSWNSDIKIRDITKPMGHNVVFRALK